MLNPEGESIAANDARELAARLALEARTVVGRMAASPYLKLTRDQLIGEAARLDIRVASLLGEEDLRAVCEHARLKLIGNQQPRASEPSPPVPPPKPKVIRIRGLTPSPTNTWVATCHNGYVEMSIGGRMTKIRSGKIVQLRYYSEAILQAMIDRGIKLRPIEEPDPED